ncbi:hypothetical protein [Christiangramia gaetbulicola]|uniref:hypothetical protein n=1 Tax=Christiangramia gaetbulicola TaxID=703340 RepID=UPI000D3C3C80|nr:hypothetical protein [Christiangramia gaetbulicola]
MEKKSRFIFAPALRVSDVPKGCKGVIRLTLKALKETKNFIKKVLVDKEKALYICTRFETEQPFTNRD